MTFTLHGQPTGVGKNSVKTTRHGRRYANPLFDDWKERCMWQLHTQLHTWTMFTSSVCLFVDYYPGDRRIRDATAILDGLFTVFEHAGLVKNDALIKAITYQEHPVDKARPRVEIILCHR